MAKDRLIVDIDGLSGLSSDLKQVRDLMADTADKIDSNEGSLGSGKVHGALEHFEHRWKDNRKKIDENAGALIDMLDQSMEQYRDVDQNLADSLTQSSEEKTISGSGGQQVSIS
ncbi:hypothetical protein QT381_06620 [Galbitalea sp. SE-J8]|uniref:hypothetical protein n=1 Tax=Galbitalea sp. SE-J8 TaxID=3054952 RepID=UPI00259D0175|nr:hypothetical protein [Galbitalea sp. SE-J8]MDM4762677.1 hypothetical protein [Galbitalea sp. SE-J8]